MQQKRSSNADEILKNEQTKADVRYDRRLLLFPAEIVLLYLGDAGIGDEPDERPGAPVRKLSSGALCP